MRKKAETKKILIHSVDTDDRIFQETVSAFHVHVSSIQESISDQKTLEVIKALIAGIRFECKEAEDLQSSVTVLNNRINFLQKTITDLKQENDELQIINKENQNDSTELTKQYLKFKKEAEGLRKENKELFEQNRHQSETIAKLRKLHFGTKSEKSDFLQDQTDDHDPLAEENSADSEDQNDNSHNGDHSHRGTRTTSGKHGKKEKGKKDKDLAGLPQQHLYQLDIEELDRKYGKGNWEIRFWNDHKRIASTRAVTYAEHIHTAVITIKYKRHMVTIPEQHPFISGLIARSLAASMMCDKYMLYVPAYRMEHDVSRYECKISRQTITNVFNKCAHDFFMPVYNRMQKRLAGYRWQQCDETTWRIIKDGRKAGRKSYFWVHRSSELDHDNPPIILYQIELTREEEHLEKFFTDQIIKGDIRIYLNSDAYSAYKMLASLYPDVFTCCFCLTHSRRRFVDALDVLKNSSNGKNLTNSIEWQIVELFGDIYKEEGKLHDLSAIERLKIRKQKISPLMEKLFSTLKELKLDDPSAAYSDTFKDAVSYTLNQEKELNAFLQDGSIPIDNNACERSVKNIAISRKNSLFSYTLTGAQTNGIILTMVRTAVANGADPYFYLLYLLTYMPEKVYAGKENENVDQMMPWSEEYKEFEKTEKLKLIDRTAPPSDEKPESPSPHKFRKETEPASAGSP